MSETATPLEAARRTAPKRAAKRTSPKASGTRRIRRAPATPAAAALEAMRDHRIQLETERLERFAREFRALQESVWELLETAAARRLDAEAVRLELAIEEEAERRAWVDALREARAVAAAS
jgi:uncharacterized protein (UPF0335 family)